jgi:integrase
MNYPLLLALRAVFNFEGRKKVVHRKAWLTSSFSIPESPVPATDKKNKPGAQPEDPIQPFSDDELNLLRDVARAMSYQDSKRQKYTLKYGTYLPAFELLLHTGLRRGDAIVLPWKDVKFDLNVITLRTGKNSGEVKIPIHDDLYPVLRAEYERQTKVLGSRPKDSSPVLLNPETGDPYSRSGLNRALEGWGQRTEIDEVRPHRFRCTFAVHCLLKELDVRRVATLLGDKVQTRDRP